MRNDFHVEAAGNGTAVGFRSTWHADPYVPRRRVLTTVSVASWTSDEVGACRSAVATVAHGKEGRSRARGSEWGAQVAERSDGRSL